MTETAELTAIILTAQLERGVADRELRGQGIEPSPWDVEVYASASARERSRMIQAWAVYQACYPSRKER